MELFETESHFEFGKYKYRKLIDVANENAMYIQWCIVNLKGFVISNEAVTEIKKIYPKFLVDEEAVIILKNKQRNYEEYLEIESKRNYDDDDNFDNNSSSSNWDNEYYNDSLDTDQQSPEWWDSL
ncbi:hypothetical protein DOS84_18735 [Flavobacterium aquariorum]|jgi:hypothetical protein|uniref:Exodeoxyribonuclease X-like C-terminal domain-containing protein n=1 Tax=Flavobacterium aquariorum TaxID=2217670 RepID=A0A2W7TNH7_9FLAO|nr:hypothetical protein [Flavobacterium aquariorum]PZX91841.1 hypothetical protein DOS84_18735 [Flavobacterium aquariorum]